MRLNCRELRRPWGWGGGSLLRAKHSSMYKDIAPLCSGLPRAHTRMHTCTTCTVMAIGTYMHVLAYTLIQGHT